MQPQEQPGAMMPHPNAGPPAAAPGASGGPTVAHEITHGPSFAMLRLDLKPGEVVTAEAGSMVARHEQVTMDTRMNSSPRAGFFAKVQAFFIAIIRKIIGGETFFVNDFSSPQGGSVWLAPSMSGSIQHRRMQGETIVLSSGAYLCNLGDFDVKMRWGGLRSLLAKEGLFMLEVQGTGDLFFTSYGGIHVIDVNGSYTLDNGHLVGFEGNLTFDIKTAGGGFMGFVASGEGLVAEFKGQGRLYIQSRNVSALVDWLTPMLPP
jgi:uncharacterized protein (TIGR00266 family)